MEDGYYHDTLEFLQHSIETMSDNLVYGYETVNNLIKEYDFIKLSMVNAADSISGEGSSRGNGGGSC